MTPCSGNIDRCFSMFRLDFRVNNLKDCDDAKRRDRFFDELHGARQERCVYIKIFIQDLRVCGRIENIDKICLVCFAFRCFLADCLTGFSTLPIIPGRRSKRESIAVRSARFPATRFESGDTVSTNSLSHIIDV